MADPALIDLVGAVSGDEMMGHLRAFARWVKLSGTAEEAQSLLHVRAQLDGYGYRTDLVLHDAYISLPGAAKVEVDGVVLTAITHSHGQASPEGGARGRLVDVGDGDAAGFAGKDCGGAIVLAHGIANPATADDVDALGLKALQMRRLTAAPPASATCSGSGTCKRSSSVTASVPSMPSPLQSRPIRSRSVPCAPSWGLAAP